MKIIQCCPIDAYFIWQTDVQLDNFKKLNLSHLYNALLFVPKDRVKDPILEKWRKLEEKYPEASFFYYEDTENILRNVIGKIGYIPFLRPWMLCEHYRKYPELENEPIFYIDSDVLLTKPLDFDKYLQDDINYVSEAGGYTNVAYLEGKVKDVLPGKEEAFKAENIVEQMARSLGLTREDIVKNDKGSGAAQYLIKCASADFWYDVMQAIIYLRLYLKKVNDTYFESENKGIQAWCADIWAVLYAIWKRGYKTECPKDFDFAWATDAIKKLDTIYIYHNAGVSNSVMDLNGTKERIFYKGAFINQSPYNYEYLNALTDKYCSKFYVDALINLPNPII